MNSAERARDQRIAAMPDMALLDALIADGEVTEPESQILRDMKSLIVVGDRSGLSKKQRSWTEEVARRVMPILASEAPKGREVETPEVLKKLPMKPPGRA